MCKKLKNLEREITYIFSELDNLQIGSFYENDENPASKSAQTIARNVKLEFKKLLEQLTDNEL